MDDKKNSFLSHLEELRKRLIICAIAVGIGFLSSYGFSKQIFAFLINPLVTVLPKDDKLIFTALPEAFYTYIKVSLITGVLLASPVIFYQIWKFIAPGLYKNEKKYIIPFVIAASFFFGLGASFAYFVVFPYAFSFFISFSSGSIKALPSIKEYLTFSTKLLLAFGAVFELPVITFFLSRMGILNAAILRKQRKYAILIIFLASAILTPPDVFTQILMSGPMILLYELSIFIAHIFGKKPPVTE